MRIIYDVEWANGNKFEENSFGKNIYTDKL